MDPSTPLPETDPGSGIGKGTRHSPDPAEDLQVTLITPNLLAYLALLAWVPIAIVLFRVVRPVTAATTVLLGALLWLPSDFAIDLPGVPGADRLVIGGIAILAGYYLGIPRRSRSKAALGWPGILITTQVLSSFITIYANPDPLRYGTTILPGLSTYDALGVAFTRGVTIGVPFFVGFRLIRTPEDVREVLRVVGIFGLVCLPLILWEVRMSPQLHNLVYGYYPRLFSTSIRGGGFRPTVFTTHALEIGLFMATAVTAAAGLVRTRTPLFGLHPVLVYLALLVGLFCCKTLGPILLGIAVPLLVFSARVRLQTRVACALTFVVFLYPLLRAQDVFPTGTLVSAAEVVSHERAYSLDYRFENEDRLLRKAQERLLFGWGTFARNRVYNPLTGIDESNPDGYWIVEMGMFGLIGFLSFFGLLTVPLLAGALRLRYFQKGRPRSVVAALLFMLLLRAVDLLPNAFFASFTLFLAGGLTHLARTAKPESRTSTRAAGAPMPRSLPPS